MLDIVLVLVILVISAITLLYAAACDALLRSDPTRDGDNEGRAG